MRINKATQMSFTNMTSAVKTTLSKISGKRLIWNSNTLCTPDVLDLIK
jgi:hypothetical protein